MTDLGGLRQQLAALLEDAVRRRAEEQSVRTREMQELEPRRIRFEQVAESWASDLVVPRLRACAEALSQSGKVDQVQGGCGARVVFAWSDEFPVSASLTVSIVPDGPYEHGCVQVEPRLIPMLVGHPTTASCTFDLGTTETQSVAQFLDREILIFAEHCLRAREAGSLYQRHALVKDPVCGMTIHPSDAVETRTHNGNRYHFCAPSCAERFTKDPERYLRAPQLAQGSAL